MLKHTGKLQTEKEEENDIYAIGNLRRRLEENEVLVRS
jgi:hypothetical protein